MTNITYENGRISITTANGTHIGFRVCDLQYKDRAELVRAVNDITPVQQAGEIGFLKTQPVEERERVLEEIMGVPLSELLGGDDDDTKEATTGCAIGCASPGDVDERLFDYRCASCMFCGDIVACQPYRTKAGFTLVYCTGDSL